MATINISLPPPSHFVVSFVPWAFGLPSFLPVLQHSQCFPCLCPKRAVETPRRPPAAPNLAQTHAQASLTLPTHSHHTGWRRCLCEHSSKGSTGTPRDTHSTHAILPWWCQLRPDSPLTPILLGGQ